MSPVYDFHCHSDQSDGALSPESVVHRAKAQGVEWLALTDHDTTKGIAEAAQAACSIDLRFLSGIEFSSQWAGRGIHVVGLNININASSIQRAEQTQAQIRDERAMLIAQRLEKAGIHGALDGARQYAGNAQIGRPHFARYMLETGKVANFNQAFKRYLGAGKLGDVKNQWPHLGNVVDWIRDAGGIPVLAHPAKYKLTRTKLCYLAEAFADAGGLAIEVVSGKQPVGLADNLAKIANQFRLAASCGSDFHVPDQPWQELGCAARIPAGVQPVWDLF